ncbi:hypothetical protein ACS0TY_021156 [Phlomoides rotata]
MKASTHNIAGFHNLLVRYGQLSGQIFSPSKSRVFYSSKTSWAIKARMLRTTGIIEGSIPFLYLGVPIFRGTPRVSYLAGIADSTLTKFSCWKCSSLSLAGRRCLINNIIAASLVHSMMIYRWPRVLIDKMERAIRNFLWSGNIHKRGAIRVSWARCCAPIAEGGLGIRSIRLANESFICKLAWDLLQNKDPALALVHDRYLFENGEPQNFHRVSSIWTGVHRHLPRLLAQSQWLVGRGSLIRFWTANWLGYRISDKLGLPEKLLETLVATVDDFFYEGCWHFDESFLRRYTGVVTDIVNLKFVEGSDIRIWPISCSGELSSKAAYGFLKSSLPKVSWVNWIWGNFIPQCRSTLVWRAIWGKLPTAAALQRVGFHGPSRCALCFEAPDDFEHIFSRCRFTRSFFSEVLRIFDIYLCFDLGFLDIFLQSTRVSFGKRVLCLWRTTFVSMIWMIWTLRNDSLFSDKRPSIPGALAHLLALIREAVGLIAGESVTNARESAILLRLRVSERTRSHQTVPVRWIPPDPGWLPVLFLRGDCSAIGAGFLSQLSLNRLAGVSPWKQRLQPGSLPSSMLIILVGSRFGSSRTQCWQWLPFSRIRYSALGDLGAYGNRLEESAMIWPFGSHTSIEKVIKLRTLLLSVGLASSSWAVAQILCLNSYFWT